MNKNIPVYIAILVAFFSFGLGILISPNLNLRQTVPPIYPEPPINSRPPDASIDNPNVDTVAVTASPDDSSINCDWCGDECVELGSRTECPDGGMYDDKHKYWCGAELLNGSQVCQKKVRTDVNKKDCDAFNNCASDESCYAYSGQGFSRCVGQNEDPCQFCPSGQCEVSGEAIYPPKIICQ